MLRKLCCLGLIMVFLYNREHPDAIRPAAVPFSLLDQSGEDYGLQIGC